MSTLELKERLIDKILHTESPELLGEVFRLLELEEEDAEVIQLSQEQKQAIQQGQLDIKTGHSLSNEQADNEIDEWLSR